MSYSVDEIVRMESVSKTFPGVKALDQVTLSCRQGEIHALVGENGAGKSTLIKILGGVYPPDSGSIFLREKKYFFNSPHSANLAGIYIVHQEFSLVPYMSVAENILLGQESHNFLGLVKSGLMRRRALDALRLVNLDVSPDGLVAHLSASRQKLVEIAKALAASPDILVVDEPTAPLNKEEIQDFFKILKSLKEKGTTILYISHHLEELFEIADRVTVLKDGRKVATVDIDRTDEDELIRMMIGRSLEDMFPPRQASSDRETVLSVRGLERKGSLHQVDLNLKRGEILGVAGLKGQGQDILLKTIFGATPKDRGEIRIDGHRVEVGSPADAIRLGMAMVTDNRAAEGLCQLLSVRDNLVLPTLKQRQRMGVIDAQKEMEAVNTAVDRLNIKTSSHGKSVKFLSGGNQQKIVVGKWLMADPRVILLIDPTVGIDVGAKTELYGLIRSLAAEKNIGVLMVTSDMLELLGMCDRILVMYEGRIVKEIAGSEATEEEIMRAAVGRVLPNGSTSSKGAAA